MQLEREPSLDQDRDAAVDELDVHPVDEERRRAERRQPRTEPRRQHARAAPSTAAAARVTSPRRTKKNVGEAPQNVDRPGG